MAQTAPFYVALCLLINTVFKYTQSWNSIYYSLTSCLLKDGACRHLGRLVTLFVLPFGELPGAVSTNPVLFGRTDTLIGECVLLADIAESNVPVAIYSLLPKAKYFEQKFTRQHTKCFEVCSDFRGVFYINHPVDFASLLIMALSSPRSRRTGL